MPVLDSTTTSTQTSTSTQQNNVQTPTTPEGQKIYKIPSGGTGVGRYGNIYFGYVYDTSPNMPISRNEAYFRRSEELRVLYEESMQRSTTPLTDVAGDTRTMDVAVTTETLPDLNFGTGPAKGREGELINQDKSGPAKGGVKIEGLDLGVTTGLVPAGQEVITTEHGQAIVEKGVVDFYNIDIGGKETTVKTVDTQENINKIAKDFGFNPSNFPVDYYPGGNVAGVIPKFGAIFVLKGK